MTDKVVELLYRSIIQHLAGNEEKAEEYTRKAMKIEKKCVVKKGRMKSES